MTPAELIIIYFAAGAPYVVYAFFNQNDGPSYFRAVSLVLKFVVWPVFVCLFVVRQLTETLNDGANGKHLHSRDIDEETARLRRDITATFVFKDSGQRQRLLEELERFAGITAAVYEAERSGKPSTPMILEATGHKSPNLGAKCIFRRNRARLLEHRNRAFDGFVYELGQATTNGGPFTIQELTERARKLTTAAEIEK